MRGTFQDYRAFSPRTSSRKKKLLFCFSWRRRSCHYRSADSYRLRATLLETYSADVSPPRYRLNSRRGAVVYQCLRRCTACLPTRNSRCHALCARPVVRRLFKPPGILLLYRTPSEYAPLVLLSYVSLTPEYTGCLLVVIECLPPFAQRARRATHAFFHRLLWGTELSSTRFSRPGRLALI